MIIIFELVCVGIWHNRSLQSSHKLQCLCDARHSRSWFWQILIKLKSGLIKITEVITLAIPIKVNRTLVEKNVKYARK